MPYTICPRFDLTRRPRAAVRTFNGAAFDGQARKLSLHLHASADVTALPQAPPIGAVEVPRAFDRAPDPLRILMHENGTTTELVVSGEWDLAKRPTARKAIQAALQRRPECLLLDLSRLSFIDVSGIHHVLELHRRCVAQNVHLAIVPGPRAVQRPFEICRLTERLPFLWKAA